VVEFADGTPQEWSDMAIDADRDALHALVDALPAERLADAKAVLEPLTDPSAPGFPDAPEDDEPLTNEDREAIRAGREEYRRGETISGDIVRRELGF
jgi:hypothetical protein